MLDHYYKNRNIQPEDLRIMLNNVLTTKNTPLSFSSHEILGSPSLGSANCKTQQISAENFKSIKSYFENTPDLPTLFEGPQPIGLNRLFARSSINPDSLHLAIAQNIHWTHQDRCQAFCQLKLESSQIEALKAFGQDEKLLNALAVSIRRQKSQFRVKGLCQNSFSEAHHQQVSRTLLHFYFFNKDQTIRLSPKILLRLAFILDRTHTQLYPGSNIAVTDFDAAYISLALDRSCPNEYRFAALKRILNLDAKFNIPELKAFLHQHASDSTIPHRYKFSTFELLSITDFCADSALLLLPNIQDVFTLHDLIGSYHAIDRGVEAHLESRMNVLNAVVANAKRIIESLNNNNQDPPTALLQNQQVQSLKNIQAQAELKVYYIKKIPGLKQKALDRVSLSVQAKYALPKEIPVLNTVYDVLRNLDPLKREYWHNSIEIWQAMNDYGPTPPNLWLWLDRVTANTPQDDRYSLWTKEEKRVHFEAGVAYSSAFGNKNENQRLEGSYIYNIGQDGQLYILPHQTAENARLTHDIVLKGKNILSAGNIAFEKGKMVYIDVASGHYKPDLFQNLQPSLAYFLEKNPGAIHLDTWVSNYRRTDPLYSYEDFKALKPAEKKRARENIQLEQLGFKSEKPFSLT